VIAVDPSSAFSGGAILGDRVRMMRHSGDPGVFIRSMATRGFLGGLSRATGDVLDLLDAFGRDVIIVETVGVGQDEIDVTRLADSVLVVLVPGMGDDIQAIKAGILEIADQFVVNKADRDGADKLVGELEQMLRLSLDDGRPRPPVLKTIATRGEGIDELVAAIEEHLSRPESAERRAARRRERARARLEDILREAVVRQLREGYGAEAWEGLVQDLAARKVDPYSAADRVLAEAGRAAGGAR